MEDGGAVVHGGKGLTHMLRFVADAGVGWQVPPGAVAELALAELSPASAIRLRFLCQPLAPCHLARRVAGGVALIWHVRLLKVFLVHTSQQC